MIERMQKTILTCYTCGAVHTIIPLKQGVNYYEFTYVRSKGIGHEFFFNKHSRLECKECNSTEFQVGFSVLEVHVPNVIGDSNEK